LGSEEAGGEYLVTTVDKFTFRAKRGLRYSEDEIWLAKEGERLRLGVTDYLQQRSGDAAFVEPVSVGTVLIAGDTFARLETIKTALELPSPVSARVAAVNEALAEHPEMVNEDPYGAGWVLILEEATADATAGLVDADAYFARLKEKLAQEESGI
jgi:glycine cleavage system H protein